MAKDRLEQHIETMKEALKKAKENIYVKKFLSLQDLLAAAERLNAAIIASEEEVSVMAEPQPRTPRRKQAKMPTLKNGGLQISSIPAADFDPTLEEARE